MKIRISGAIRMSIRQKASSKNLKQIKTFTYFIPAPPNRKTGYREKEFDKIMNGILQSGFEILDLQTQSVETGVFIFAQIKANSKKTFDLDKDLDIQDKFKLQHSHTSPEFELDDEDA
jgi:hypothetical protein